MAGSIKTVARTALVTAQDVRDLTGFNAQRDVSDAQIVADIARAAAHVIGRIAHYVNQLPMAGPIDGSNVRFEVPRTRKNRTILDVTLDEAETSLDASVLLEDTSDDPPTYTGAAIASIDATTGQVTLAAAPPKTTNRVLLTARILSRPVDKDRLQNAIAYYAAHLVSKSATRSGKVNLTNPQAESQDKALPGGSQSFGANWLAEFKQEMRHLAPPHPRAASVRTRMPRGDDSLIEGRRHAP